MPDPVYAARAAQSENLDGGRAGTARLASTVMAVVLGLAAWMSLVPYFVWSYRSMALIVAGALTGLAAAVAWFVDRPRIAWREWLAGAGLTTFLLWATVQHNVAGGHTLWIFVLPTVAAIVVAGLRERRLALRTFELVFIVTLIPGVIVLALMIAGVPLTFSVQKPPSVFFAANGIRMLVRGGAVFIESNSQALPWGGIISRLCGMFDEPGTIGTISALLLAARAFEIRRWQAIVLWIAGILSFSLAFVVLVTVGLVGRALLRLDWKPLPFVVPVALAGLFAIGVIKVPQKPREVPVAVRSAATPQTASKPIQSETVRQQREIDNRSQPGMTALFKRYRESGWSTIAFGIASDASVVYGGASAVWTRVLTNHGLLGFALILAVFGGYGLSMLVRLRDAGVLLFLLAYGLSFYQRPVIWLPYALLIYFGGLAALACANRDRVASPRTAVSEDHASAGAEAHANA